MILLDIIIKDTNKLNVDNLKHLLKKTGTKNVKELLEYLKDVDIIEFVEIDESIDFELTDKQKEVLKNMVENDRSVLLLGKGSAKTSLTCLLFRFMITKDILMDELQMNRIDYSNMCSTAKSARDSFFREFAIQMKKSKIFNMVEGLYKIRKNECGFLDDRIVMHSLNSQTSSFEGKNLRAIVIDEISEPSFRDGIKLFEDGSGSVFSRFDDGKAICLSWTRYPAANPMSDNGYYLYDKYKDDNEVYTLIASTKEMRGFYPKDYDPNDVQKVKMYDCIYVVDNDTTISIDDCDFVKKNTLLKLEHYHDDKYVRFKIKELKRPKTKWCFGHIDTSIKKDSTVIVLYYNGYIEYHLIKPENGLKVSYEDLEIVVKELRKICVELSFDKFNSEFFSQKYNCLTYTFSRVEQYDALQYFKSNMDEIKIIINNVWNERLTYEFSHINIDNVGKKWNYLGKGSSDIADSIIYCVFNSRLYQTKMKKNNKNMSFGFNVNLF